MKRNLLAAIAAGGLMTGVAYAHHSFAATYFEDQTVTVEGDVVQFLFRNPHSFVHIDAKDPKTGTVTRWAVEWGGGGQLGRQGVTRESIKAGQHVTITGNPGRTPEDHRLRMVGIKSETLNWKGTFD